MSIECNLTSCFFARVLLHVINGSSDKVRKCYTSSRGVLPCVSVCVCDHRNPERGSMFQLGTTGKLKNEMLHNLYFKYYILFNVK
jgi:hypothetical protein